MAAGQTQENAADAGHSAAGHSAAGHYASGKTIEVAQIERELRALWKDAAESSTSAGQGPVVRACTMNLVAPCSNDLQFQHVSATVEKVAAHHPCRAILVRVDLESQTPTIGAQASTLCSLAAPGQRRVCHEQIQLFASEGCLESVAPAVLGLLVPDVPAYVWAPCEKLLSGGLVRMLAADADALILDSHRFSDPFRGLAEAFEIGRDHRATRAAESGAADPEAGPGFGVLDLEWIRLHRWFDATACAFEHAAGRGLLGNLQSLRVEYATRADSAGNEDRERITPALYAGWFATRAGWAHGGSPARRAGDRAAHGAGDRWELGLGSQGRKKVALVPRVANERAGAILEVEVAAGTGRMRLRREPGADFCVASVESTRAKTAAPEEGAPRSARVSPAGDVDALAEALATAPRDEPFERAARVALAFDSK